LLEFTLFREIVWYPTGWTEWGLQPGDQPQGPRQAHGRDYRARVIDKMGAKSLSHLDRFQPP
jgi:hypothetical protein